MALSVTAASSSDLSAYPKPPPISITSQLAALEKDLIEVDGYKQLIGTDVATKILTHTSWDLKKKALMQIVLKLLVEADPEKQLTLIVIKSDRLLEEYLLGYLLIKNGFHKITFLLIDRSYRYDASCDYLKKSRSDFLTQIAQVCASVPHAVEFEVEFLGAAVPSVEKVCVGAQVVIIQKGFSIQEHHDAYELHCVLISRIDLGPYTVRLTYPCDEESDIASQPLQENPVLSAELSDLSIEILQTLDRWKEEFMALKSLPKKSFPYPLLTFKGTHVCFAIEEKQFMTWELRRDIIVKVVVDVLLRADREKPLTLISLGSQFLLMEYLIARLLTERGFEISFIFIDPIYKLGNLAPSFLKKLFTDFKQLMEEITGKECSPKYLSDGQKLADITPSQVALLEFFPPNMLFQQNFRKCETPLPRPSDTLLTYNYVVPISAASSLIFFPLLDDSQISSKRS